MSGKIVSGNGIIDNDNFAGNGIIHNGNFGVNAITE